MTNAQIKKLINSGTMFEIFKNVYCDVFTDRYYVYDEDTDTYREAELGFEVRYSDSNKVSESDLLSGFNDDFSIGDYDFDISGEFDNPIETSGEYIWRYGYFKFLEELEKPNVTHLIDLTNKGD